MEADQGQLLKEISLFLDKKYLKLWVTKLGLEEYYQQLDKINLEEYL